jgi:hypothetical protein
MKNAVSKLCPCCKGKPPAEPEYHEEIVKIVFWKEYLDFERLEREKINRCLLRSHSRHNNQWKQKPCFILAKHIPDVRSLSILSDTS